MRLSGFATRVALGVVVVALMLALVADPAQAGWRNRVYAPAYGYGYGYPVAPGYTTTTYAAPMATYYNAPAMVAAPAAAMAPAATATTTTTVAPVDAAVAPAGYNAVAPAGYSATTVTTSPTMYQTQYIGSPYTYGPTMIQRRGLFGRTRFVYPRTVFAY